MATKIKILDLDTIYLHRRHNVKDCINEFEVQKSDSSIILKKDNCIYIFDNVKDMNRIFDDALFCFLIDSDSKAYECSFNDDNNEFVFKQEEYETDCINCDDIIHNFFNKKQFPVKSKNAYGKYCVNKVAKIVDGELIIENIKRRI